MLIMPFSLLGNIKCLPITFQPRQFLYLAFKASSLHLYSRTFLCPSQAKPLPWPKHRLFFSSSVSLFLATPSPRCIMVPLRLPLTANKSVRVLVPPGWAKTYFFQQAACIPCGHGHFPSAVLCWTLPYVSWAAPYLALLSFVSSFLPTEFQRGPICLICVSPEQPVQLLAHRRGSINAGWIILEKLFENVFLIFTSDSHFSFEWIPPLAPWYFVCVLASSGA